MRLLCSRRMMLAVFFLAQCHGFVVPRQEKRREEEEKGPWDQFCDLVDWKEVRTAVGSSVLTCAGTYFLFMKGVDSDDKKLARQFEMDVRKATAQLRKKFVPVVPSLAKQMSRVETSKATRGEGEGSAVPHDGPRRPAGAGNFF